MKCRHCKTELKDLILDLGEMPPSNSYLSDPNKIEKTYPLKVYKCHECHLVQTEDLVEKEEMFSDSYAYFSSQSKTFLAHAKSYVEMIIERLGLNKGSKVLEIACNDGYLLQYFVKKEIQCLGIEPTLSTATEARKKDVPVLSYFFGKEVSDEIKNKVGNFDLIIGNNVLAHVPDLNDFLSGVKNVLPMTGTATFEFPYLLNLIKENQFDTIYHEHFSYFSVTSLVEIMKTNGLEIYDIEKIPTHGGSLRIYVKRFRGINNPTRNIVKELLEAEEREGVKGLEFYENFKSNIDRIRKEFNFFINFCKENKIEVIGYGAAAKANTFLNYVKANSSHINKIIDTTPAKQNKFLPGSKIPIYSEEVLKNINPRYIIIFPWNFKEEIINKLRSNESVNQNCRFITFIPKMEIFS